MEGEASENRTFFCEQPLEVEPVESMDFRGLHLGSERPFACAFHCFRFSEGSRTVPVCKCSGWLLGVVRALRGVPTGHAFVT